MNYKWFLKYLKCIHARFETFIKQSQYQAQKYEQNKTRTPDKNYEHINTLRRCRN